VPILNVADLLRAAVRSVPTHVASAIAAPARKRRPAGGRTTIERAATWLLVPELLPQRVHHEPELLDRELQRRAFWLNCHMLQPPTPFPFDHDTGRDESRAVFVPRPLVIFPG